MSKGRYDCRFGAWVATPLIQLHLDDIDARLTALEELRGHIDKVDIALQERFYVLEEAVTELEKAIEEIKTYKATSTGSPHPGA